LIWKKTFVFQKNLFLRFSFVFLAKIVIFDSDATSNSHRFMYFRYKDKSFDENTPNDPKNLTLKKKLNLSVSHHFMTLKIKTGQF